MTLYSSLWAVLVVFPIVRTVAHVPKYYIGLTPYTNAGSFQIFPFPWWNIQRPDGIFNPQSPALSVPQGPIQPLWLATLNGVMHWANVDAVTKSPSLETRLLRPIVTTCKENVLYFMECLTAGHGSTKAIEQASGTVFERDLKATDYSLQASSKSGVELPSDMRSKMKGTWADFSAGPKLTSGHLSKMTWSDGPTVYSCRYSRISSPHSRTH